MKDALVAMLRKLATDIQNDDVDVENVSLQVSDMHNDHVGTVTTIEITENRP